MLSVGYDDYGLTMPFRTVSRNVFIMNFIRVSGVTASPCVVHHVSNSSTSTVVRVRRLSGGGGSPVHCAYQWAHHRVGALTGNPQHH